MPIHDADVRQICAEHGIDLRKLKSTTGSFGKRIFFINDELLLRLAETSMEGEQARFARVRDLDFVPKIVHTGAIERETGALYYTLLTLLPGADFVNVYAETTPAQQAQLGRDIAAFLDLLHAHAGRHYDIGLYIPVISHFAGTWQAGHQQYWELLRLQSADLPLQPDSVEVFARAFRFLKDFSEALGYQAGPKVLHNDFHPKNILLHRGRLSGVIDWECSQLGEPDFELCHLVHWCLYPPEPAIDFRPFLRAFLQSAPGCAQVPDLAQRLTLYEIEHEIQQIIWSGGGAETMRVPRLVQWLDGGVDELLEQLR